MGVRWHPFVGRSGYGAAGLSTYVRDIPAPGQSQVEASPPSLPAHAVRPGGHGEVNAAGSYGPPETRGGAAGTRSVPTPGRAITLRRTAAFSITYGRRRPVRGPIDVLVQLGLVSRVPSRGGRR